MSFQLPHQHGKGESAVLLHEELSKTEHFQQTAELFKQLGDPTRIRIFWLLCHREECVINIAAMLDMSSPAISHHLRSLLDWDLLQSRRVGKEVYYRSSDNTRSQILHQVVEELMAISCPERLPELRDAQEEVIHQVHRYLMDNLAERITIEELSRHFHMNPTSLKQAFKQVYGNSLAAHMKAHRMEKAARLLLESSDPVADVARAVGYESQSRFTAAFKEHYGVIPSKFRNAKKTLQEDRLC